jgi:hypothetical protein
LTVKRVYVIFPAVEKNEVPRKNLVTFESDADIHKFNRVHHGSLSHANTGVVMNLANFIDDEVYTFIGGFYEANRSRQRRGQEDDKVFEHVAGLTVKNEVGAGAHMHANVIYPPTGDAQFEIDCVIHDGHETVSSTAYVVESSNSPQVREVDILLKKVEKFKASAHDMPHFKSVKTFIPVLAGRLWPKETIDMCDEKKIVRVTPSGGAYKVVWNVGSRTVRD